MADKHYYPAGSYNDPRAPWNEPYWDEEEDSAEREDYEEALRDEFYDMQREEQLIARAI